MGAGVGVSSGPDAKEPPCASRDLPPRHLVGSSSIGELPLRHLVGSS